jgi:hypothetical protein
MLTGIASSIGRGRARELEDSVSHAEQQKALPRPNETVQAHGRWSLSRTISAQHSPFRRRRSVRRVGGPLSDASADGGAADRRDVIGSVRESASRPPISELARHRGRTFRADRGEVESASETSVVVTTVRTALRPGTNRRTVFVIRRRALMARASLDNIISDADVLAQTADDDVVRKLADLVSDLAFHVKGLDHYINVEL